MISMMPDALLARQLRVSGALASRPLKEDPRHVGVDDGITAPRGMGAPLRPHARERHSDLPPSCWHLGGFFFQAEDGIRDPLVTGVQTCALPIFTSRSGGESESMNQRAVSAP